MFICTVHLAIPSPLHFLYIFLISYRFAFLASFSLYVFLPPCFALNPNPIHQFPIFLLLPFTPPAFLPTPPVSLTPVSFLPAASNYDSIVTITGSAVFRTMSKQLMKTMRGNNKKGMGLKPCVKLLPLLLKKVSYQMYPVNARIVCV